MTATATPANDKADVGAFTPSYIAFGTLTDLIERMEREQPPARIDRSYLDSHSGGYQGQILATLRELGMLEDSGAPSELLKGLVQSETPGRKALIGSLMRKHYGPILALGKNTTQEQFVEAFAALAPGIRGETRRKAIKFFLAACKYAEIEVSPYWRIPRPSAPGITRRAKADEVDDQPPRNAAPGEAKTPAATLDQARVDYLAMLMKRAESQDDLDEKLLDRIEKLLGYESSDEE